MATANEKLRDAVISHAFQFERLRAGLDRSALAWINTELRPALTAMMGKRLVAIEERGRDIGKRSTERLKRMQAEIDALISGNFSELREMMATQLQEIGGLEAAWLMDAMDKAGNLPALGISMTAPSQATIRQVVRGETIRGGFLRDWFKGIDRSTRLQVKSAIDVGIVSGQSTDEIVRGIIGTRRAAYADGLLQRSRREVTTMVRTAATHVSARARQETMEANGDVLKGWQFVATLDTKTTVDCIDADGTLIPLGETGPTPPLHFNCRSSLAPWLKSWKEMGINLSEAPEGTRESLDGQVPESKTAKQWLKEQSKERQIESLGKTKAKWFRNGELTISQMTDASGRELTATALAKKYGLKF